MPVNIAQRNYSITEVEDKLRKNLPYKYKEALEVIHPTSGVVDSGTFLVQIEKKLSEQEIAGLSIMIEATRKKLGAKSSSFLESDNNVPVTIWEIQY